MHLLKIELEFLPIITTLIPLQLGDNLAQALFVQLVTWIYLEKYLLQLITNMYKNSLSLVYDNA